GEELLLQRTVRGCAPGERGDRPPPGPAHHVHEEELVLGGGVSGAEHGPGPGGAGDVGSPGGFVADDGDVLARPVTPLDLVRGNAERMVVEELVDGVS